MPPQRSIRPLRLCCQTRWAFNGPNRRPLSTRRGDDAEAPSKAQDRGTPSQQPRVQSRGKGWWASFAKRVSSSVYGHAAGHTPERSNSSESIVQSEPQTTAPETASQQDRFSVSRAPISSPGESLNLGYAKVPNLNEIRAQPAEHNKDLSGDYHGEDEKHLATEPSDVQSSQAEAELGTSTGTHQVLQEQLKELREQVRLLQEALVAKQGSLPLGESRPEPSGQVQRAPSPPPTIDISPPLPPTGIPAATQATENATLVRGGLGTDDPVSVLNVARHLIKLNGSRLISISRQLREMNSTRVTPLQRSLNEKVEIFKEHLSEAYVGVARRRPRFIVIESLLLKAELELEDAIAALDTQRPKVNYTIPKPMDSVPVTVSNTEKLTKAESTFEKSGGEYVRLVRELHTKSDETRKKEPQELLDSPRDVDDPGIGNDSSKERPAPQSDSPSLLEELFPEATTYAQPHYTSNNPFPKLDLPKDVPLIRPTYLEAPKTARERITESFRTRQEAITVLQLVHCSTELTEADFRRLIPKGKHIESWIRDGEFDKIIPGRDPLTLERLPFYYLLFKSPESALAYQNNAARLHKLAGLHEPSSIHSAIPPPKGMLEDGEDLNKVLSTYFLKPTSLKLTLHMLLQPYNPSLRALIERGGYEPIVPSVGTKGQPIWKVLLHIEGWEPSRDDLYHTFKRHAYDRGLTWPFHNGSEGIHRLRDIINVNTKIQAVSSANPRAANGDHWSSLDPLLGSIKLDSQGPWSRSAETNLKQFVTNRLYNRWIVEFEEEIAARRFARMWHRRLLPAQKITWKDAEEPRMINAEFLW
ncbi:uncharacterized protein EI97DRAFT_463853 [Westerdykella ornata]|uniref:Uncharacterized protein n=1 Tax=Westerdykella ornata TaxID=318751 RepID=A0A6A6JZN0_WESOR|nr:uncharacterized protein EI97DRAFT_463853 [Westerdykella ornata]KAF2281543.1 hypothetical protein EI97DRAFT_463853 [Westerdykella ornata]